jgi:hypothetical protein
MHPVRPRVTVDDMKQPEVFVGVYDYGSGNGPTRAEAHEEFVQHAPTTCIACTAKATRAYEGEIWGAGKYNVLIEPVCADDGHIPHRKGPGTPAYLVVEGGWRPAG